MYNLSFSVFIFVLRTQPSLKACYTGVHHHFICVLVLEHVCTCICVLESHCTWCAARVSCEGHIEGWLISQRRWIHPSADEEASTTAEQYSYHQQHPKLKAKGIPEILLTQHHQHIHAGQERAERLQRGRKMNDDESKYFLSTQKGAT